jgi:hypothetical protein
MASIEKLGPGKYEIRWRTPDGKSRRKVVRGGPSRLVASPAISKRQRIAAITSIRVPAKQLSRAGRISGSARFARPSSRRRQPAMSHFSAAESPQPSPAISRTPSNLQAEAIRRNRLGSASCKWNVYPHLESDRPMSS